MEIRDTKPYMKLRATYKMLKWTVRPRYMQLLTPFRQHRVLPDFLIAGAPKCGTTSLFAYLCQHPGMVAPVMKEVGYLNHPENFKYGEAWYRAHFPRQATMDKLAGELGYRPITGEATPGMSVSIYSINAHKVIPDAKTIMILRNPVDRAFSQYHHQMRKFRRESLSFWDALQAEPDRTAADREKNLSDPEAVGLALRRWGYMHKGEYIDQIETWLKAFQRDKLLILNFEDLITDPGSVCNRAGHFLGLPAFDFRVHRAFNKGNYKQQMEDRCRDLLTEHFRPYNRRLFEFLGEDWGWPS